MKVFFDEECLLHHPAYEFLSGKLESYFEAPKRLLQIRQALEEDAIFQIENADRSIDVQKHALQVHSEDYIEYLESAFRLWVEGGGDPKVRQAGLVVASTVTLVYCVTPGSALPRDISQSQARQSPHHHAESST
jgi:acetoin utilization deacetylase AcuC-like enzyme